MTLLYLSIQTSQGCSTVIKLPFQVTLPNRASRQYFIKLYIKLYNEVDPGRNDSKRYEKVLSQLINISRSFGKQKF